jgi:hypothetical protein
LELLEDAEALVVVNGVALGCEVVGLVATLVHHILLRRVAVLDAFQLGRLVVIGLLGILVSPCLRDLRLTARPLAYVAEDAHEAECVCVVDHRSDAALPTIVVESIALLLVAPLALHLLVLIQQLVVKVWTNCLLA